MYNPNDAKQNYPFCRLNLLIEKFSFRKFEPTYYDSIKVPKNFKANGEITWF